MPVAVSRKAFLRGAFRGERAPSPLRPPWALSEDLFSKTCDTTGKCREACPEGILVAGRDGRPEVSFERGECTFCGKCVEACASGALAFVLEDEGGAVGGRRAPWTVRAEVRNTCLSLMGTSCRICGDQCEARAIRFRLAVGGIAWPEIDGSLCTGCGACVGPCPNDAIRVH